MVFLGFFLELFSLTLPDGQQLRSLSDPRIEMKEVSEEINEIKEAEGRRQGEP